MFGDSRGVTLIDYLNKGKTITGDYHSTLLDKVCENLVENRHGKEIQDLEFKLAEHLSEVENKA